MTSATGPQGSLIMLWAGEDPAFHATLLEELQSAGIPFSDKPVGGDQLTPKVDVFRMDLNPQFGFEVSVLSSNLSAAEKILERLLGEEPADVELPAEDDSAAVAAEAPVHLSRATCAVWSGEEQVRAEFLSQALRENEIPVRVETLRSGTTLYVPPEEETLAREIIREIVEGAPPA